nr:hypothetical protein [Chloroflexaceae bacterium]
MAATGDSRQQAATGSGQRRHAAVPWSAAFVALWSAVWSRGVPLLLATLALLAASLAYQLPFQANESLVVRPTPVQLAGVYQPEPAAQGFQRWTTGRVRITFPGAGSAAASVRLRFFGGDEAGVGRLLTVSAAGRQLAQITLRPYWQEIALPLPPNAASPTTGDLTLTLELPTFRDPNEDRLLGVSLAAVEVIPHGGGLHLPPTQRPQQLALVVLLLFWSLRLIGIGTGYAAAGAGALLALLAVALAGWPGGGVNMRLQATAALPLLLHVLPMTLALAFLCWMLDFRCAINRASAQQLRPNAACDTAELRSTQYVVRSTQFIVHRSSLVYLAVLIIFTMRLAGVLHPQFINVDHGLRANQLLNIAEGRVALVRPELEQQFEWGTREPVPYSLLTYYMLLPLAWFAPTQPALVYAVKVFTVLLEATIPLLLWALLRGGPQRELAAAWASLCYAALPIGYLFFHDGSFPTTMGVWLVLLALMSVRLTIDDLRLTINQAHATQYAVRSTQYVWPALTVLLLALAMGAYVTHIAFMPFLSGVLALSVFGFGTRRDSRRVGLVLLGLVLLAFASSWIVVYGSYTATLVQRTIPAYLGLIASEGAVGRDSENFFGTPINTFPQHLHAHFRTWPVLLAAAALAALLVRWRDRFVTHVGVAF